MRAVRRIAPCCIAAVVAIFAAPALLPMAGLHPLVVRGGSMGSALRSGDAIVVRSVPARALEVGDIVTLPDPTSARGSITHRIVGRTLQGQEVGVVTKGDASRGSERWSLDPEHRVGRFLFRVPALGHVAGFVSLPWTRAGVIAALLILMVRAGGAKRPSGHRLT